MSAEQDLKKLFVAMEKFWPYKYPRIELSTEGYLFFRQKKEFFMVPFPVKTLMSKESIETVEKSKADSEGIYISTGDIEWTFREFIGILLRKVSEEDAIKKEKLEKQDIISVADMKYSDDEEIDKFVYPNGAFKKRPGK